MIGIASLDLASSDLAGFALGCALLLLTAWALLRPAWRQQTSSRTDTAAPSRLLTDELAALDAPNAAHDADGALARNDLLRRLLDEPIVHARPAMAERPQRLHRALLVAVPLFAAAVYAGIGQPAGLSASPAVLAPMAAAAESAAATEAAADAAVDQMLEQLGQRLATEGPAAPDALQGWTLLARAQAGRQRFKEADAAYARALAIAPDDAQLLVDRADVLAVLQGGDTRGEPDRLIARALGLDPRNLKALALAGSAADRRGDTAEARERWQAALALAPAGSAFADSLRQNLAALDGPTAAAATTTTPTPTPPAAAVAAIEGELSLSPALADRVSPDDTVFVVARSLDGAGPPLAVLRRTARDLPLRFTLDDSLAVMPQRRLSTAERVVVSARISRSGDALPQAGDLSAEGQTSATRASGLRLVIGQ